MPARRSARRFAGSLAAIVSVFAFAAIAAPAAAPPATAGLDPDQVATRLAEAAAVGSAWSKL
ncbi:MAG TPA: hypothetical protein VMQ62_01040, partial [Dongiaceae bacterium]|nr:hypothetical protein [Dongiaceae bacterium]